MAMGLGEYSLQLTGEQYDLIEELVIEHRRQLRVSLDDDVIDSEKEEPGLIRTYNTLGEIFDLEPYEGSDR